MEPNEFDFCQSFSKKVVSTSCFVFNSLSAREDYCCLLITFANSLDPDHTADNLLNAKPAVQQKHPGDLFPVSQRGSAKVRQSVPVPILMIDIDLFRK